MPAPAELLCTPPIPRDLPSVHQDLCRARVAKNRPLSAHLVVPPAEPSCRGDERLTSGSDGGQTAAPPRPSQRAAAEVSDALPQLGASARRLGVALRELGPEVAKERKLPTQAGLLIETVDPKGAGEKAGLRPGDVILEINGEQARSIAQVRRLVNETPAGQAARLSVFRAGQTLALSVVPAPASPGLYGLFDPDVQQRLDELRRDLRRGGRYFFWSDPSPDQGNRPQPPDLTPGPPALQPRWPLFEWSPGADRLGVVVQELGPQLAEYFKVKGGVLVASATRESPAQAAGLKAGDVITAVDGKSVNAPSELLRMIRGMPDGMEVSLSIVRSSSPLTIKVKLGSAKGRWHV